MKPPVWWRSALLVNGLLSARSSSSLPAAKQGQAAPRRHRQAGREEGAVRRIQMTAGTAVGTPSLLRRSSAGRHWLSTHKHDRGHRQNSFEALL